MLGSAARWLIRGPALPIKRIDTALAAISGNVKQFKLLVPFFKKKYPKFVEGYKINVKLNHTGIKHSGVEGVVTDAATGQPTENALCGTGRNEEKHKKAA